MIIITITGHTNVMVRKIINNSIHISNNDLCVLSFFNTKYKDIIIPITKYKVILFYILLNDLDISSYRNIHNIYQSPDKSLYICIREHI